MALAAGTRLGPYEITAHIGTGGMGQVYRATDTKLKRQVAIKILPPSLDADADRLMRFQREAEVLASLNHPHIAAIYGLEGKGGNFALVMELVEGEDLSQRIDRGAIPLDETLRIARQIAEALEAAHEQGIIHRDLKPANIKVRDDGTVKVLDFGLAKMVGQPIAFAPQVSTTAAQSGTMPGLLLGTAAYMAPEQAHGKPADRRADIWAFGCVLFEMLTATRAFAGVDLVDTLAAVRGREPDWRRLPAAASIARPLLARCLKKDPRQRLQAIGDVRLEIDELIGGAPEYRESPQKRMFLTPRRIAGLVAAAFVVGLLAGGSLTWLRMTAGPQPRARAARFEIVAPIGWAPTTAAVDRDVAISPDGQHIVYATGGAPGLVMRAIDSFENHHLRDTTGARSPFFSPDGQWVGFFDGVSLKKVSVLGGAVITICPSGVPRGASWGDDGTIVFATFSGEVLRVSAAGGEPSVVTKPGVSKGEYYWYPSLLPAGRGILFTVMATPNQAKHVAVLDSRTGQVKTLVGQASQAEYLGTRHLVFVASGGLHAVRFDLEQLAVRSDPVLMVADVAMSVSAAGNYSVSRTGALVYVPDASAGTMRSLVWVDRKGRETAIKAPRRLYSQAVISPDGARVALVTRDEQHDIHILDLTSGNVVRLTLGPAVDNQPVWTLDGRIIFASTAAGPSNLFVQSADGSGEAQRLTVSSDLQVPGFVTPDGRSVVGTEFSRETGTADIVRFPLTLAGREAGHSIPTESGPSGVERLVQTRFRELNPEISPDGRYIAYQSDESGRFEIWVRPFPQLTGRWQVSAAGGTKAVWAKNGKELFYLDLANTLTAVPVQTSAGKFVHGTPARVFDTVYAGSLGNERSYDASPDGQRFLMLKENDGGRTVQRHLAVVLNWVEELKAKVP